MVAKFEGISINEVWGLSAKHFLNDLLCIKLKNEYDARKYSKSTSAGR